MNKVKCTDLFSDPSSGYYSEPDPEDDFCGEDTSVVIPTESDLKPISSAAKPQTLKTLSAQTHLQLPA